MTVVHKPAPAATSESTPSGSRPESPPSEANDTAERIIEGSHKGAEKTKAMMQFARTHATDADLAEASAEVGGNLKK